MAVSPTKVSMENLVPEETYRKSKQAYFKLMVALVFVCIVAIVMTALFAWKLSENSTSFAAKSGQMTHTTHGNCPEFPPILPKLPSPLPDELGKSLSKFDSYLSSYLQGNGLPAISSNVYYKDSIIWSGHHGRKTLGGNKPDDNTRYRIGSITKVFPVLMVYILYHQGKISSLDDPLNKYTPEFFINNPFTNESITLREIINQLSGLPREAPCVLCNGNETTQEQLKFLRNLSLVIEPGTMVSYSNLGYALLGRLLPEILDNSTFEEWTHKNILSPLGLNNTGFVFTNKVKENMAFPYDKHGHIIPFLNIGWLGPSGQMYSTVNELAQLGMFLMGSKDNHNIPIKTASLREIMAPSSVAPDGRTMWGSPWEIFYRSNFIVRTKGGAINEMSAMMVTIPELKLGLNLFVSAVKNFSSGALVSNIMADKFIELFLPVFNRTLFKINDESNFPVNSTKYSGTFNITFVNIYETNPRSRNFQATIERRGNKLVYKEHVFNSELSLFYIGKELMLQARQFGNSCFVQRLGSITIFHFKPVGADGLSSGFTVPQLGINGQRV